MKQPGVLIWSILFILQLSSSQFLDTMFQNGAASSIPGDFTPSAFDSVFNVSTRRAVLSRGDSQLFFLRWFQYDGPLLGNLKSFTSPFVVKVDDYGQLTIPNSVGNLVPVGPTLRTNDGAYRNLSLLYYQTDATTKQKKIVCGLTPRGMWLNRGGDDYAVKSRTVQITLKNGIVAGCDWAPSVCLASATTLELDSICADNCNLGKCNYNITMFLAWSGTDSNGNVLNSYNRDLYRLKNPF
ncbi:hypothetical protein BC833DRAFT_585339 [Globomyces pollinis-pini]|nr:hypothetical protein BC833DRAFT_585339 [Globomyces pollinis-pini]